MLVFRSEDHLDRWLQQRSLPRGGTLTLEQCWALADAWYAEKHQPDWRRYRPEEAQAIFERVGLTGPFWRLS